MHRGHDHDHHHHHDGHAHGHHHHHGHPAPGPVGHNAPGVKAAQWQTPHLPHEPAPPVDPRAADMDLVETAFLEGFSRAPDPVSFLRLAGIAFVGEAADGTRLHLLRVETEDVVDVGSVMPLLGGEGLRYDPLPSRMTSHRRRLGFLYHDGATVRRLGFADARALADRTDAARIDRGH
ncbi:hypothetical protein [Oharaeibacter diazotrophicus]|uniref:Uncharacterized protein n=1 Tax=Oharaeibacter diazotrophicus TaxID=1920512 RepID=A0A4R6RKR0_9HYPH|nr:hypothetical protein [Oharaeibacter diazotrophicus]TDP87209.1 hypothetical protein EDD54_1096 [Oharaeibacter diazotrophicus]BBE70848.1 hypothetical protein OHA_1_00416 [Pleomorphomonas sp. SM30]GLS77597.1 hypothetical protein GCM10007904_29340 [Oharaeibacter diazotrophicus]